MEVPRVFEELLQMFLLSHDQQNHLSKFDRGEGFKQFEVTSWAEKYRQQDDYGQEKQIAAQ